MSMTSATPESYRKTGESAAYAAARVERHKIEDATIAVRVFGQGPPLALVHGYPVHGYTWRRLLPTLAEQFTCYVVDLPGLGDSDWSPGTDFSFTAQAHRLGLLLVSLGLSRYSLIAHDTGATIARLVAAADPKSVGKLVIINTEIPGHRPPRASLYRHAAGLPGAATLFSRLLRSPRFIRSAMGEFYTEAGLLDDPSYIGPYVNPLIESPRRMAGALGYLRGIDWRVVDAMRHTHSLIRADTLFLWGEDDRTFPVELAEEMRSQMGARATFVRVKNASLMPHEERPDVVLKHMLPFLNGATI